MSNELDKHFQEKLGNYASPVDADALWQAVRPPRKRRLGLWLWLLPLALGLGAAAWWMAQNPAGAVAGVLDSARTPGALASPRGSSVAENKGEAGVHDSARTPESLASPRRSSVAENKGEAGVHNSARTPSAWATPAPEASTTEVTQPATAGTPATGPAGAAVPTRAAHANSATQHADAAGGVIAEHAAAATQPTLSTKDPIAAGAPQENTPANPTALPSAPTTQGEATANNSIAGEVPIAQLPGLDWPPLTAPYQLPAMATTPTPASPATPRRRYQPWTLGLSAAYYLSEGELRTDSMQALVQARQSTETVLEALGAEASLAYRLQNGWQVKTGLGYHVQTVRFEEVGSSTTVDTVPGIVRVILSAAGDTIDLVEGSVLRYQTTQWRQRVYNSYRVAEVPLLLGYTWRGSKWEAGVEAGIRLGLYRSQQGRIRTGEGTLANLEDLDYYRSGITLRYQAGAQLAYALAPNWRVTLGMSAIRSMDSWTTKNAPLQERYQWLGMQLGVGYRW